MGNCTDRNQNEQGNRVADFALKPTVAALSNSVTYTDKNEPQVGTNTKGTVNAGVPRRLRTMTFNILADSYAKGSEGYVDSFPCPELFRHEGAGGIVYMIDSYYSRQANALKESRFRCRAGALLWSRRWPMLKNIIIKCDSDLIGLQEVDMKTTGDMPCSHEQQIREDLASAGYEGVFARKGGSASDGVALFWRTSRLKPSTRSQIWTLPGSVHVALAQPLTLDGGLRFLAVCTHLKSGLTPDTEDIRAAQVGELLKQVAGHPQALILADLNSHNQPWNLQGLQPNGSRAVVKEIHGRLAWPSYQVHPKVYPLVTKSLRSACAEVFGHEPNYTSWSGWSDCDIRGVFDYILIRGDLFKATKVLKVAQTEDLLPFEERLPNVGHPSDHFPLVIDFSLTQEVPRPLIGSLPTQSLSSSVNPRSLSDSPGKPVAATTSTKSAPANLTAAMTPTKPPANSPLAASASPKSSLGNQVAATASTKSAPGGRVTRTSSATLSTPQRASSAGGTSQAARSSLSPRLSRRKSEEKPISRVPPSSPNKSVEQRASSQKLLSSPVRGQRQSVRAQGSRGQVSRV